MTAPADYWTAKYLEAVKRAEAAERERDALRSKAAPGSLTQSSELAMKRQGARCFQHRRAPNRNGSREDHVMAKRQLPSPEVLRQLLRYEAETGRLFWRPRTPENFAVGAYAPERRCSSWNSRCADREAFTARSHQGYKVGRIHNTLERAHRVIWAMHYGEWPASNIDHIDGDKANNSVVNLRLCDHSSNAANVGAHCDAACRSKGVSMAGGRFAARIMRDGKQYNLGSYGTEAEAAQAYDQAAKRLFGEYAKLNGA